MNTKDLLQRIENGESSSLQFKRELSGPQSLAAEIAAFANGKGGVILVGVEDRTGRIVGLDYETIQETARLAANVASQGVVPPVRIETETFEAEERKILAIRVPEGPFKPYKDSSGNIWVKQGADKRRTTDNLEILSLLQESGLCRPDETELPDATAADLDDRLVDSFFRSVYGKEPGAFGVDRPTLLRNLRVLGPGGRPTVGGLLFFGSVPQWKLPSCAVKAVAFAGTDVAGTRYLDSKDVEGTLPEQFERTMSFLKANLHYVQHERSVNMVGELEVPEIALEELLQNALVHRDYLIPAAVRVLVFDDRVEIVSPGCLPNGLSVDDIRLGTSFQRNPLLASLCAKTMRYRGLGSGILRTIRVCADVRLENDEAARVFRAVLPRPGDGATALPDHSPSVGGWDDSPVPAPSLAGLSGETPEAQQIYRIVAGNGRATLSDIAQRCGLSVSTVRRVLGRLRSAGLVRRDGARKNGEWKTIPSER